MILNNKINQEHGHAMLVDTFSSYIIRPGGKFAGRGKYQHALQSRKNIKLTLIYDLKNNHKDKITCRAWRYNK